MKRSAFTLVELSIVLVIIGLLVGGSFKVLQIMRDRAEITKAQDNVKAAKEAVVGYVQTTNELPTTTVFNSTLSPVKSNQHPLFYTYGVDPDSSSDNICTFLKTDLKLITSKGDTINNIAFVVASEAANRNMQTAVTSNADGTYSVKTYTYATKVDDNTSPVNIVENYDDVVDWVTLVQLKENVGCSLKPFSFLNITLPLANVGETYDATLYVENNISDVSISCTPTVDKNITFSNTTNSFSGIPDQDGTSLRTCTATENESSRTVTKQYVITINPVIGGTATGGGGFFGGGFFGGGRGRP